MGTTYTLKLDTFEYEEDTSLGTIQMEQIEESNKIAVELFPNNQSKESFENAEFSQIYDIFELAPIVIGTGFKGEFSSITPTNATEEQKEEIHDAIRHGVGDMLETIINIYDFTDTKINSFYGEIPLYPILKTIRENFILSQTNYFLQYRAETDLQIEPFGNSYRIFSKDGSTDKLLEFYQVETAFNYTDTLVDTDEKRMSNIKEYLEI